MTGTGVVEQTLIDIVAAAEAAGWDGIKCTPSLASFILRQKNRITESESRLKELRPVDVVELPAGHIPRLLLPGMVMDNGYPAELTARGCDRRNTCPTGHGWRYRSALLKPFKQKVLSPPDYRKVLLQLVASLTLCDTMGDVAEDIENALKAIGYSIPDGGVTDEEGRYTPLWKALHADGITTLQGSSVGGEEG